MKIYLPAFIRSFLGAVSGTHKGSRRRRVEEKVITLSNGAELAVDLRPFDPVLYLPPGKNGTTSKAVHGTARVGHGGGDVHFIYILDTSGSTSDPDGECGTVLECMVAFFESLHQEIMDDGSAKFISFIEFDYDAHIVESLHHPSNFTFEEQVSDDITVCSSALEKATEVINDPENTAETNIVVFASDGYCNGGYNLTEYADLLGATGAIVHSVAVGDAVDCNQTSYGSSYDRYLSEIPRNGGQCIDLETPEDHTDVVENITGSWLQSLEVRVDQAGFVKLDKGQTSKELPQEGVVSVSFRKDVEGLQEGKHEICVRATGRDSMGDEKEIENCLGVFVQQSSWLHPWDNSSSTSSEDGLNPEVNSDLTIRTKGGPDMDAIEISGLAFLSLFVLGLGFCFLRRRHRRNAASKQQEGAGSKVSEDVSDTASDNGWRGWEEELNDLDLKELTPSDGTVASPKIIV